MINRGWTVPGALLLRRFVVLMWCGSVLAALCGVSVSWPGAVSATSSHFPPPCANNTTNLEDPATADAYSANSWVAQHTVAQDAPVTIYTGAYDQRKDAAALADPAQRPVVTGVMVLNDQFTKVAPSVSSWSLSATNTGNTSPVIPDCAQGAQPLSLHFLSGG